MCESVETALPDVRVPKPDKPEGFSRSWQELFPRPAPIVCDLGAGNGRFAAAYAELHPEWNVLAVERKWSRVRKIERAAEIRRLPNLRTLWFPWDDLLLFWSRASSCREIHVLFPDPWPKRRHRIRRTLTARVLAALYRALEPGGCFRLLTDDSDYYGAVERMVAALPGFDRTEHPVEFPWSHFETIFRSKGDPLYGAIWQKGNRETKEKRRGSP
ncbi:tRNA (guanine-N(7)-)-methyltransferase [Methylacidimicrobium cyclopophantes]|uniref:tRNA (guanine(46)-N(7))-methyltransferase n=1 Tax=Methylacidimicrobium cyclopophantes TaxID=1041766 RepID=A0A5E6MKV8_9BACT|nr:tRNA (guanine-N(7)-)-methyltransferase [Methylacidimicrobium cyclopophantes]